MVRSVISRKESKNNDVALIEKTFNALSPKGDLIAKRFYDELFRRYPVVKPLFSGVPIKDQQKKLLSALGLVVKNMRNPVEMTRILSALGKRHQGYGAEPEYYQAVAVTLLDVMREFAGNTWTDEVHSAWSNALNSVASIMLKAYSKENTKMAQVKKAVNVKSSPVVKDLESIKMKSAVDGAMTSIMMIDRDLVVTYANQSTVNLLREHEDTLKRQYPGFSVDNLIGTCIDIFHKNPSHQRRILGDPRNLPYSTDIQVGPLKFRINVTAINDDHGDYIGNCLEWSDVTSLRSKENEVVRLHSSVEGAMTAIMMIDRDLVITYANEATRKLLTKNADALKALYPAFDVGKVVGTCIDIFHKNPSHQRNLLGDPKNLPYSTDIKVGPLIFRINVTAIKDSEGAYIGNCLEWQDVTEQRAKETDVARLESAISGSTSPIMLCDSNLVITYVNPSVVSLLEKRQDKLRHVFPGFDAKNLVGLCIDKFHKNPAHQRSLLADKSRLPAKANIKLLDVEFSVNATAIVDQYGNWVGNMVQWDDITEQMDAERQIQGLIEGAANGDLSKRIDTSRYEGFMKNLGEGINQMVDSVVAPIKEATQIATTLADGDLTRKMEGDYKGEFAVLRDNMNASVENLLKMVGEIRESASSITSSASEISQGNTDLSQRTEEQASSLEETASSMEELTSTVKQNADNARQANQLAASAREQAEKGGSVVGNAIIAMTAINSSSKKIADIIGVIDEIAFQTNLLALNAAVEAARAGEQGRGFAVVAAEVRNLAQRSATAAKEIKTLIKDSVEKVEEGSRLVDASGKTLEEIVGSVKKVSDIIAEIASASQEQSAGIEQVNKAIMQMDEVTQQNAALVEEAAAASESLDEQAQGLGQLMEFFKVDEEGQGVSQIDRLSAKSSRQGSASMGRSVNGKAASAVRGNGGVNKSPSGRQGMAPSLREKFSSTSRSSAKANPSPKSSKDDGEWEEF